MTTTDITTRPPSDVSAMPAQAEWNAALAQAATLAQTQIVPAAFRRKPHDIVAVWLIGREMGLSPMMAMQYINIIEGKPSVTPELMNGRIRAKGHAIRVVEWTATVCRLKGIRADTGEELEVEFTIEDAQRAKLVKDGGNWVKWPKAMLWARALSMLARALFADVIMGASYIPEELGAEVDEDGNIVGADAPTTALPDDLAAHVAGAPIEDVDVLDETKPGEQSAEAPTYATLDDTPAADTAAAADGFGTLPEPEPPTAEELHAEQAGKLFRNGWPMGRCKGGDPMDPDAVDTGSLEYLAGLPVKDDQWKATELERRAWIANELTRRARLKAGAVPSADEIREGARMPRSGETHADLNEAAAQAAAADDEYGDIPFDAKGDPVPETATTSSDFAPTATTPEFPPAEAPADALDAPLNDVWHNRMIDAMVEYGYAEMAADAAHRIAAIVKRKAAAGETYPENAWAAGQIAAFRKNPGPNARARA